MLTNRVTGVYVIAVWFIMVETRGMYLHRSQELFTLNPTTSRSDPDETSPPIKARNWRFEVHSEGRRAEEESRYYDLDQLYQTNE